jgi:hypothetical protein
MIPKRPFWLAIGAAVGAGSSLWVERRIRRAVQDAASRLQPDALALEIGRSARQIAESTGERVRSAVSVGRDEMRIHEEQLWQDLSERRGAPLRASDPLTSETGGLGGSLPEPADETAGETAGIGNTEALTPTLQPDSTDRARRSRRTRRTRRSRRVVQPVAATKSASHLGN